MAGISFVADPHLSRLTWADRPTIVGDSFYSLHQVTHHCLTNRSALVLLGDVFDSTRPDSTAVAEACRAMDQMQQAQLPVFYIQGNHEKEDFTPWMSVHAWPQHVDRKTFTLEGVTYYGLDWRPSKTIKEELQRIPPEATSLLLHQSMIEMMGTITQPECSAEDMPDHVTTIYVGDYHDHVAIPVQCRDRSPKMIYSPGAFSARNIRQIQAKGFWYRVNGAVHSVPLQTRPAIDVTVHRPEDLDEVLKTVQHYRTTMAHTPVAEPLVRIHFAANEFPDAKPRMSALLGGETHLFTDMSAGDSVAVEASGEQITTYTPETLIAQHVADQEISAQLAFLMQPQRTPREAVQELINEIAATHMPKLVPAQG